MSRSSSGLRLFLNLNIKSTNISSMNQGLKLLKSLESATGQTQHVIALIFDVRGFTNFCKTEGDSVNIANFVRRIYIKVIREYFSNAIFFKPTGDGMLIVFKCKAGGEAEIAQKVLQAAVKLVSDFPKLCSDDKLVYFKTPSKIGVGISRGSACCILSKTIIVDFSGRPLNLAARLSDIARPSGVVFDESVSSCIQDEELEKFPNENVYLKGLAEDEPIKIFFTKETNLPNSCKKPLNQDSWETEVHKYSFSEIENWEYESFKLRFLKTPSDVSQIILRVQYPRENSNTVTRWTWNMNETKQIYYEKKGLEHGIVFNVPYIIEIIKKGNVAPSTKINFEAIYPV
jgi:class 3 adenylate cyclase